MTIQAKKLHTIGVRIDETVWKKLQKLAKPENVSILIRRVLSEHVNNVK